MNRINQKGIRPQDKPIPIGELNDEEKALIRRHYPDLVPVTDRAWLGSCPAGAFAHTGRA